MKYSWKGWTNKDQKKKYCTSYTSVLPAVVQRPPVKNLISFTFKILLLLEVLFGQLILSLTTSVLGLTTTSQVTILIPSQGRIIYKMCRSLKTTLSILQRVVTSVKLTFP